MQLLSETHLKISRPLKVYSFALVFTSKESSNLQRKKAEESPKGMLT